VPSQPPDDRGGPQPRTPRAVINEAIRETAGWDRICWWMVVVFGLTGVMTIAAAVWQGSVAMGVVGAIAAALCWPALHYAIAIRKGNVALRLLELALNNVQTAEQALQVINQAFGFHFGQKEDPGGVVSRPKTQSPQGSRKDH
jgi:hypothetical protein